MLSQDIKNINKNKNDVFLPFMSYLIEISNAAIACLGLMNGKAISRNSLLFINPSYASAIGFVRV